MSGQKMTSRCTHVLMILLFSGLTTFFSPPAIFSGQSFYSIGISTNKYPESAENEVEKLKEKGYNAFYRYENGWYKVYIGKYNSFDEAKIIIDTRPKGLNTSEKSIVQIYDGNLVSSEKKGEKQYSLHISSFKTQKRADSEISRLKNSGVDAFYHGKMISGTKWFRVYTGQFDDKILANQEGSRLKNAEKIDSFTVRPFPVPAEPVNQLPVTQPVNEKMKIQPAIMPQTVPPPVIPMETKMGNKEETIKEKYLRELKAQEKTRSEKQVDPEPVSGNISVEEAEPIIFKDLMARLLNEHDTIKYSIASVEQNSFLLKEARSERFPRLDLYSDYGYERITREHVERDTEEFRTSTNLKATQLITNFGKTSGNISKSKFILKQSEYELEANRQKLLLDGITAYLNIIKNREMLKYYKKSENNIKKQTGIEETLVKKGAGLSSNVLQAKTQLANSQTLVAVAQGALETAKNNFNVIFQKLLTEHEIEKLENPPLTMVPITVDAAVETALQNNISISLSQNELEIIRKDLKIKKTAFFPQLNLFGDNTYSINEDGIEAYKNEAAVGIELSYNLFRSGGDRALVFAARKNLNAAKHQLANIRHVIEEQTRNAWHHLETLKKQTTLLEHQANIAAEFLKLARKERRLGNRSLLDILNGEITYINAVSNAITSKIDLKIAVYQLLYVTGQLNLEAL